MILKKIYLSIYSLNVMNKRSYSTYSIKLNTPILNIRDFTALKD